MKPIKPEGSNLDLGKPADWDEERDGQCSSLPALRTHDGRGHLVIQTTWEPDAEELAALNAGAPVVLTVWGVSHPPVALDVGPVPAKSS